MTATETTTESAVKADKRHFYLRRLHSLSGVIPVGLFLIQHIYGNAMAMWGRETYDEHVHFLLNQPLLPVLEIGLIAIPIAFHALLGVYFMADMRANPGRYSYARNWLYTAQRITAWITLVYVVFHVTQTRFSFDDGQKLDMYNSMQGLFQRHGLWLAAVYVVGTSAAAFHLCNGIWAFCIVWGITIHRKTQKMVWLGAMGLWVLLTVGALLSVLPLAGYTDPMFKDANPVMREKGQSPYQGDTSHGYQDSRNK
ncbi:MAG: succinate dehydrogenase/fumarate reductase transmembrane subunit [Planctomycetota bacterium]|jgi:succinate dehydrogenase / fumarate reductase cytochrome b subunit